MQDRITVKINSSDVELFMSFPLLTRCASVISNIENLPALMLDASTQQVMLRVALQKKFFPGKKLEDIEIEEFDMSVEEAQKVLGWIEEHLTDFFVKAMERLAVMAEKQGPVILALQKRTEAVQNLMPSANGTST